MYNEMMLMLIFVCFLGFSPHSTVDGKSVGKSNNQKHKHRHRERRDSKQQDPEMMKEEKLHRNDKQHLKARHRHKQQEQGHCQPDGAVTCSVVEKVTAGIKYENNECSKKEIPGIQVLHMHTVCSKEDLPSEKDNTPRQLSENYEITEHNSASRDQTVNIASATEDGKSEIDSPIGQISEATSVLAGDDSHTDVGMKHTSQKIEIPDKKLGPQENKENENCGGDCVESVYGKDNKETVDKSLMQSDSSKREDVVGLSGSGDNSKCPPCAKIGLCTADSVSAKSSKAVKYSTKQGQDNSSKQKSRKPQHKSDSSDCSDLKQMSRSMGHSKQGGQNSKKEPRAQELVGDSQHVEEHECMTDVSRCLSLGGLPEREAPRQVEASEHILTHDSAVCDKTVNMESDSGSHSHSGSVTCLRPGEHSYHRDPKSEPQHRHHNSSKHKTKGLSKHEHHHKHRHERHRSSSSKSPGSTKSHTSSSNNDKVEKLTTNSNSKCAEAIVSSSLITHRTGSTEGRKLSSKSPSSVNHRCNTLTSGMIESGSTSATGKSRTPSKDSKRSHSSNVEKVSGSNLPQKNDVKNGLTQDMNKDKLKKGIPECMSALSEMKQLQKHPGTPGKHVLPNGNSDGPHKKRKLNFDEALLSSDNQVVVAKANKAVTPKKTKAMLSVSNVTPTKTKEKSAGKHLVTPRKRVIADLEVDADKYLHPSRIRDVAVQAHLDYTLQHQKYITAKSPFAGFKYGHLLHRECDPNGGAWVLHSYKDELAHLSTQEMQEFVGEYFDVAFSEDADGASEYTMAIVHGAAADLPDPLEYLALKHSNLIVKIGAFGRLEIDTMTVAQFRENVHSSYCAGTHHAGGMMHISLVGVKQEETGDYLAEFLDLMECCPFLCCVMPWGTLSTLDDMPRDHSNDGPILWNRPGEQMVLPVDSSKSPFKRKRLVQVFVQVFLFCFFKEAYSVHRSVRKCMYFLNWLKRQHGPLKYFGLNWWWKLVVLHRTCGNNTVCPHIL